MKLSHLIRPATPADAAEIAHVHVESWRTAYSGILPADFLLGLSKEARQKSWLEILSRTESNATTFVAESEGQIIGFANGGPERTNDSHFAGELYAIYLLDTCRGQGIGTTLFQKMVESLLSGQMASMKIWVLRDNPYRRFYERLGGKVVGEKPITIAGTELVEMAYGWETLERFRQVATIRRVRSGDSVEWLRMRHTLWPDEPVQDLATDMLVWLQEQDCVALVAERINGSLCGFLEVAIRPCNVNGAIGRFGYIEGWYVDSDVRQMGIGTLLVEAAEEWVKDQCCDEILSDARIENTLSAVAHQAIGFVEVERLVHFRKRLT